MRRLIELLCFLPAFSLAAEQLSDPTRPLGYSGLAVVSEQGASREELLTWHVTAIRISDSDATAVINERLVGVGDSIGSAKVVRIDPTSVLLRHQARPITVYLLNNSVHKMLSSER